MWEVPGLCCGKSCFLVFWGRKNDLEPPSSIRSSSSRRCTGLRHLPRFPDLGDPDEATVRDEEGTAMRNDGGKLGRVFVVRSKTPGRRKGSSCSKSGDGSVLSLVRSPSSPANTSRSQGLDLFATRWEPFVGEETFVATGDFGLSEPKRLGFGSSARDVMVVTVEDPPEFWG